MPSLSTEHEPSLSRESAGLLMTPEEFDSVDDADENYRYELVQGVLVVLPIPLPEETGANELLGHYLLLYRHQHPEGAVLDDTLPQQYVRGKTGRRLADRVLWTGLGYLPDPKQDIPSIAVEFVSGSARDRRRDYVDKKQEYREAGLQEYWIIDRFARTMTVIMYRGKKAQERVVHEGETYETPLLPGFQVPLKEILRAANRRKKRNS